MSSHDKKIIAIVGGTGAMGRPIIASVNETNQYLLRVLTRNTKTEQAIDLANTYANVQLFEDTYTDEQAVRKLFTSVYGVFCNTDIWNCGGYESEINQGKMMFNVAKELHVKHFIYSSLDHTKKLLANHGEHRCFHYDAKAIVAEYIESQDSKQLPWTIITTAPYFENFQSVFLPTRDEQNPDQLIFTLPMADKPLVMVAIDDIAWFVKYSFENPEKSTGKNFYIAGDNITLDDAVRIFTEGESVADRATIVERTCDRLLFRFSYGHSSEISTRSPRSIHRIDAEVRKYRFRSNGRFCRVLPTIPLGESQTRFQSGEIHPSQLAQLAKVAREKWLEGREGHRPIDNCLL